MEYLPAAHASLYLYIPIVLYALQSIKLSNRYSLPEVSEKPGKLSLGTDQTSTYRYEDLTFLDRRRGNGGQTKQTYNDTKAITKIQIDQRSAGVKYIITTGSKGGGRAGLRGIMQYDIFFRRIPLKSSSGGVKVCRQWPTPSSH
ncbi:hypothetical protein BU17DRAFT_62232 [Hysterangium stoloniferum]|nr:hypothetical protein BU17DRAFT_62232 [Hysterangium stoloniferum]